ncbi:Thiamine biosynthesis protein ThiH, partial [human gut metagenome]
SVATEFINDEEILSTLKYAEENKSNKELITSLLASITMLITHTSFSLYGIPILPIMYVLYSCKMRF